MRYHGGAVLGREHWDDSLDNSHSIIHLLMSSHTPSGILGGGV